MMSLMGVNDQKDTRIRNLERRINEDIENKLRSEADGLHSENLSLKDKIN